MIPYEGTLSSIDSISFWTKIKTADLFPGLATLGEYWANGVAREGTLAPYIILELDTDGDGMKDDWLVLYHYGEDSTEWVQRSLEEGFHTTRDGVTGQSYWHSVMHSNLMDWPKLVDMGYVGNIGTLDQWQGTELGDATVLYVKIAIGEGPGFAPLTEVYVDDIEINEVPHDLEPNMVSEPFDVGLTVPLHGGDEFSMHFEATNLANREIEAPLALIIKGPAGTTWTMGEPSEIKGGEPEPAFIGTSNEYLVLVFDELGTIGPSATHELHIRVQFSEAIAPTAPDEYYEFSAVVVWAEILKDEPPLPEFLTSDAVGAILDAAGISP